MIAAIRPDLRHLVVVIAASMSVVSLTPQHSLHAQAMPAMSSHAPTTGAPASVTLTGVAGEKATMTAAELATLPRTSITVFDAHTKLNETFSGVLLTDLLARVNAPLGEKLHGNAMGIRVIAEGADHYTALYSLAEIDPAFHPGTVIIADTMDGKPLNADHGPLQLVNTEDKRPARWVRQLVAIRLVPGD